jgi:23S rRNA (uridine2552-2'-O)-methyltransferase
MVMVKAAGSGARDLAVRVKSKKSRKPSSARWLERQLNDPYVARARREGYRSRSAFKLIEIDDRFGLLRAGKRVVDLGAAPGGWSQVASARMKSAAGTPNVVALDLLPMDPIAGVSILEIDFLDDAAVSVIASALGGARPDIIISDMAASTTGHRRTDALRTEYLYEAAAAFAVETLAPGGHFLAKVFRGGAEAAMLADLKRHFGSVVHVKPKASRPESVELYLLARNFKGG